jgi:hypothetical protein
MCDTGADICGQRAGARKGRKHNSKVEEYWDKMEPMSRS